MAAGDPRATQVYDSIGTYFGYAIGHYADFYEIRHLLVLGRVTSGAGGNRILDRAGEVLEAEFPRLAEEIQLHTSEEKDKRHGQAIAAASLPSLKQSTRLARAS
jgi:predicted NBD/HSP70 family sugar kinase